MKSNFLTEENLDAHCSKHFKFRDVIQAGETWQKTQIQNLPRQPQTVSAIELISQEVLDPLHERFGDFIITHGFTSWDLIRKIRKNIDPSRDQHAEYELKPNGSPICDRLGQSVDLLLPNKSMRRVALWIAENRRFDRIYFYGDRNALHVSVGPQEKRQIVSMLVGPTGRRVPAIRSIDWLKYD